MSRGVWGGAGQSWNHHDPTDTLQNTSSSLYLSCSFNHNPKTGANCPQNVGRRQYLIPKVEFLPDDNLPLHLPDKLGNLNSLQWMQETKFLGGEVFLVFCSRSSCFPIYPPFLHLLPNSELVMFVYMPPMLLAARDDGPFLKCIFFPPNICTSERQSWIYQCGFSCEPN